ncbi:MAG: hypothetical protein GW762_01205 [Candidatus Pacebacteria bacterium]|nr:hypothetical protein [Candidatus Paceibacterota bacterium]PIR63110.1 MAG: hypothetical protein COU64_06280 [Candidatus Pacebacteria bacterium CG10_big_fil_rev_8_21_14_0_10_40_26]PIZ78496.1 MAG: hypothetical protein COY01_04605 [Candidatus Pacebacteria bacterium CG_4_10_14_0_2_um_filter_40_20]PJA69346.1 MAG: hypothetical protein CO156_00490 [Candidatus Pacebacteria bacterium CG_4_9_14_3_um_filter_40_12]PJC41364.1 MAG: hypothetical protein CO041_04480 [Candidatus Pacebacteria bacterium CG_4_9_
MTDDTQKLDAPEDTTALPAAEEEMMLESGDDLAAAALASSVSDDSDDETIASDQLATTLSSLQNVIERNADLLTQLGSDLKLKRESLKNVFDNDTQLSEATQQQQEVSQQVKERKSKLLTSPEVTQLKTQIGELNEQKKEIEEALSNHLLNYYQLTNSMSFDTSDGDQWEFGIRAKVKGRKKQE